MNKKWLWLGISVCGCTDKETETQFELPGTLQLRVAPGVESDFTIADMEESPGRFRRIALVVKQKCKAFQMWICCLIDCRFRPVNGVESASTFPVLCRSQGETEDFAVFEIRLDIEELAIVSAESLSISGQTFILELGTPGWVHPPSLGIEPSSTFLLDSTHPQHDDSSESSILVWTVSGYQRGL